MPHRHTVQTWIALREVPQVVAEHNVSGETTAPHSNLNKRRCWCSLDWLCLLLLIWVQFSKFVRVVLLLICFLLPPPPPPPLFSFFFFSFFFFSFFFFSFFLSILILRVLWFHMVNFIPLRSYGLVWWACFRVRESLCWSEESKSFWSV